MTRFYRHRSARAVYESHFGPNMTPMVDVVMVILIFFMASAAILGPEWFLKTSLPVMAAGKASDAQDTRLRIELRTVDGIGSVVLSSNLRPQPREMGAAELEAALAAEKKAAPGDLMVLIAPDARTPYERVVFVHEACARAGIVKVGLIESTRGQ